MKHHPSHSPNFSTDAIRQYIFGAFLNASSAAAAEQTKMGNVSSGRIEFSEQLDAKFCRCLTRLDTFFCADERSRSLSGHGAESRPISSMDFHSDLGRMFSFVIFALMVRSISRSKSSAELETLLETMRFREELDIQLRQKHRLRKAKRKVTAWLCRGNGAKLWQSSPHILLPNISDIRNNSLQSTGTYIPEIVISTDNNAAPGGMFPRGMERQNSYTPSLSLIYDFSSESRKGSQVFSSLEQDDSEHFQQSGGSEQLLVGARLRAPEGSSQSSADGSERYDEGLVLKGRGRHGTN